MHEVGYIITEHDPDYVVLGETGAFSLENLTKGIRLIINGARFVATNPDPSGPTEMGIVPACGAVAAMQSHWGQPFLHRQTESIDGAHGAQLSGSAL